MDSSDQLRSQPPPTASSPWTGIVGLAVLLIALKPLKGLAAEDPVAAGIYLLLAMAAPMILLELFVFRIYRRSSADLRPLNEPAPRDWTRVGVKLVGYYATLGALYLIYNLLPMYNSPQNFPHLHDTFMGFVGIMERMALPVVVLPLFYFPWLDRRMRNPRDGYWHAGCFTLLRFKDVDWSELIGFARGWLVKGFFVPLMLGFLVERMRWFGGYSATLQSFGDFYEFGFEFIWFLDLGIAALGYLTTFKLLDSHIRSAEPTFLGWFVALLCYPPFWDKVFHDFFAYETGMGWGPWMRQVPFLFEYVYPVWGSLILILLSVYVWAGFCFGLRFSNLTHRGIITSGAYRLTKHPAYVAKNLSWWLIALPFLTRGGFWEGVAKSFALLGLNFVYFMRARTEERHLSMDPTYVQYAMWMNKHSLLAPLGRILPFLRYKAPESAQATAPPAPDTQKSA